MTLQITNTTLSDGSIRLSCIHNGKLYTKAYSLPLLQARAVFRSFIRIAQQTQKHKDTKNAQFYGLN